MIIELDMYSAIRTRYIDGESIRSIAKSLNISRPTVKKYCEGSTHPEVRKDYQREPDVMTEAIKAFMLSCFKQDDDENLKKQKHTAKKIYDRLVSERGFSGSYSSVRTAVRSLKAERTVPPQSSVPLSYAPGEAVQIDWGEATVYIDGHKTKLYTFCGRLCYSCDIFVQAYKAANLESFLEAQKLMFDFFGGTPRRLIFDNAKVAVKEGFGIYAKPQDRYLSFSSHYAFSRFFDNIDHELLMKAVCKHTEDPWVILYIKRWLKAPFQMPDGTVEERTKGTPQGGVISPILANLFLHYAFDKWMEKHHPNKPFARYADDGAPRRRNARDRNCRVKLRHAV